MVPGELFVEAAERETAEKAGGSSVVIDGLLRVEHWLGLFGSVTGKWHNTSRTLPVYNRNIAYCIF